MCTSQTAVKTCRQLSVAMEGELQGFCCCVSVVSSPLEYDGAIGFLGTDTRTAYLATCEAIAFAKMAEKKREIKI